MTDDPRFTRMCVLFCEFISLAADIGSGEEKSEAIEQHYSRKEAAQKLCIHPNTFDKACKEHDIPPCMTVGKGGKRWRESQLAHLQELLNG